MLLLPSRSGAVAGRGLLLLARRGECARGVDACGLSGDLTQTLAVLKYASSDASGLRRGAGISKVGLGA